MFFCPLLRRRSLHPTPPHQLYLHQTKLMELQEAGPTEPRRKHKTTSLISLFSLRHQRAAAAGKRRSDALGTANDHSAGLAGSIRGDPRVKGHCSSQLTRVRSQVTLGGTVREANATANNGAGIQIRPRPQTQTPAELHPKPPPTVTSTRWRLKAKESSWFGDKRC